MSETLNKELKKNIFLDVYKIILSFFVICIHSSTNPTLILFCRIAIPAFFIISGFYLDDYKLDQHSRLLRAHKSLINNAITAIIPFIISLIAIPVIWATTGQNIFLINHFWFIGDILLINALYIILIRFKLERILYIAAIPLLLLNFVFGDYSGLIFDQQLSIFITRNTLFTGIPFFTLGLFLRRYITKLNWKIYLIIGIITTASFAAIPFESQMLNKFVPTIMSLSISISFSAIGLTMMILYLPSFKVNKWYVKFISKDLTRYIYLWNLLISTIFVLCGFRNVWVFFIVSIVVATLYSLALSKPLDFLIIKTYSLVTNKNQQKHHV